MATNLSPDPEIILGTPITTILPDDTEEGEFSGTTSPDYIQVDPNIEPFDFNLSGLQGSDTLIGGAGNDLISGNTGDDRLDGLNGADVLFGNTGVDLLSGGAANDEAYGGQGNDTLVGDIGDDILSGDKGMDLLIGGPGHDLFIVGDRGQLDAAFVDDFVPGQDQVLITGANSFGDLDFFPLTGLSVQNLFPTINQFTVGGTLISVKQTGEIIGVLNNVFPEQVSISDFRFLPPRLPAQDAESSDSSAA
ncbi:MAG: calcium-binding protein [Microcoleaceae cyanobacterium]